MLTITFSSSNSCLGILQLLSLDLFNEFSKHTKRGIEALNASALADISNNHVQSGHTSVHIKLLHLHGVKGHAHLAYRINFGDVLFTYQS